MRRLGGRETWHRLLDWDKGHTDAERLIGRLLAQDGFRSLDPSHPLGGPDGGKDLVCLRDGERWRIAVYFPRGKKADSEVRAKFTDDFAKHRAEEDRGFTFATNQELTLGLREELCQLAVSVPCEIYHLERIALMLDIPRAYGLRLEYLSIDMTREEQVAFINDRDAIISEVRDLLENQRNPKFQKEPIKSARIERPDAFSYAASVFGGRLVACIRCKEVFRAFRDPLTLAISASIETVTCPSCGKLQGL